MKIGLQTWGTDGDFFPFLALAIGLKNAGNKVTIVYTSIDGKDHSGRADANGIQLIRANAENEASVEKNPYAFDAKAGSFREYTKLLECYYDPHAETMYEASKKLCQENDLVIGHAVCHTLLTASQKFSCPRISLVLTPLVIRSNYVSPIGVQLGKFINSFLWMVGGEIATRSWFKTAKKIREREGLQPVKSLQKELFTSDLLNIVAASPSFVSRPKDWPKNVQMTGFLNLPSSNAEWKMPEDLKVFLEAGEPPIYMTFGSCMQFDVENSTKLLIEAAQLSGKRTIIQSDRNQLSAINDPNIYCIENAPHSEIFPHCSVIVHHGGAGTTQAALFAGKPSVVVAHGFDQPYWGNQLEEVGAGGKTLNRKTVKAAQIATEIQRLEQSDSRALTIALGRAMENENGVSKAIALILSLNLDK